MKERKMQGVIGVRKHRPNIGSSPQRPSIAVSLEAQAHKGDSDFALWTWPFLYPTELATPSEGLLPIPISGHTLFAASGRRRGKWGRGPSECSSSAVEVQ